eukprot:330496_1
MKQTYKIKIDSESDQPLLINEQTESNQPSTPSNSTPISVDDESLPVSFGSVLRFTVYRRYLLYFLLLFIAFYERAAFLSGYGAAYFAGCKTVKENNNCSKDFNYDKFNQLYQIAFSMAAIFSFISAPIVGTLSDKFGRKPFMFIQLITYSIPYIFMLFSNNIYIFLILYTLIGVNGATQISTPVTSAYISDILPQRLHIMGFALIYLLSGVGLLIGEIVGYIISSVLNDHFNFYTITMFYVICLIYLFTLIPEPKKQIQNNNEKKSINPCNSFRYCCMNNIVFWISLLTGMVSLPAMGLVDIATVVLADNFNANGNDKFNQIALLYITGWSIGLILGPIIVLPILRKYFTEFNTFIVTVFILLVAISAFMIICLFQVVWTIPITSFILGIGFLCFAPLRSILTKYIDKDKRGNAFGSVFAFSSICNIIAPTGFAFGYHYLKQINAPSLLFAVSFVMLVIALIFSFGLK